MSLVLVGSDNPVKVRAVGRALDQRPELRWKRDLVDHRSVESGVNKQPTSIEEMVQGARNRVRALKEVPTSRWANVSYSDSLDLFVGIESGIFRLDRGEVLDLCFVYLEVREGASSLGTSSAFLVPNHVASQISQDRVDRGYTLDNACRDAKLTTEDRLGYQVGLVGLLSGGLLTREDYTFEAVRNALFGLVARKMEEVP